MYVCIIYVIYIHHNVFFKYAIFMLCVCNKLELCFCLTLAYRKVRYRTIVQPYLICEKSITYILSIRLTFL